MRAKVAERPVRQNIEIFLRILGRTNLKKMQKHRAVEKLFQAWINKETGKIEEFSTLEQEELKPIEVHCMYDSEKGEVCFYLQEVKSKENSFRLDDLSPQAFKLVRDTLKIINAQLQRLKGPSDLETKIAVISKLQLDIPGTHGDGNILIEAWHHSDRIEAETLLWDKPKGTYLFRKDIYAQMLEDQLQRQFKSKIKCLTLTYSYGDYQFKDLTLIHFDGCWLIYDDDPSLENGKRFSQLPDLLNEKKADLKYPLFAIDLGQ